MHDGFGVDRLGRVERGHTAEAKCNVLLPQDAKCALKVVVVFFDCAKALLALEVRDLTPEFLPLQAFVAVLAGH